MSLNLHSNLDDISSKIDKMDEELKYFSDHVDEVFITPFHCFLYYDVKTAEKDEEMFVEMVNWFIDYILTYKKDRAELERQYIETAAAITASKGETVEPKTLDLDCFSLIMRPLYKIIKTIEYSDLIEDGLWVKTIDKAFDKDDLVRKLKEVYGYLKEGMSEAILEVIDIREKRIEKNIKDNIDSLRPSCYDKKYARETIVRFRKAYETKEDSPVFEPDEEPEVTDDSTSEEDLAALMAEEDPLVFADGEESEELDDSTSEEEALAALMAEEDPLVFAGGKDSEAVDDSTSEEEALAALTAEEDLEFADEAPPVEDDSPSSSASTAEGEMVGSTGLISEEDLKGIAERPKEIKEIIIRNREKEESIENYEEYLKKIYQGIGFSVQKENGIRKRYPHEEEKPPASIKTSKGEFFLIVEKNPEISNQNSYEDYCQYIKEQESNISNINEFIKYLTSHLNEGYQFYYIYITQLIEILSNSEKQKSLPEHYKVDLSISFLFVTKTFTIYVSPKAISDINDGKLVADNLNGIIGAINSDAFEIPYIKSMKIINKELCKDEPLTISGDSENDTTPVEEDILPGAAPGADDYTSEDIEASEEDGFTHEDVVAPAEGEDSPSTKDKAVRQRAPRITVPKSKKEIETIITYKYSIYKMIVSELIKEEKEISKENFRSVLKNMCDNQPDNVRFKLEFDKNSDEYILVSEEDGEKQTMTISYSGFITSTSARFKPINDKQEYEASDRTSKISLNLRNIAPEKVDRNKAIIYTCLTDAKISVNSKKLVITRFIRQLLAKYQAKVIILYKTKQLGVGGGYTVDFNETDENEDITLPLTNRDPREPIEIEVYLKNDKRITISLEPVAGAKRLKI